MTEDYKQLGLGQYKLHHLVDVDPVEDSEVEYLLEPRTGMAVGTEQQNIADAEQPLTDQETRYLLDSKERPDTTQQTLDT